MGGVDQLEAAFASGQLVRPTAEALNFIDLVRALAGLAGAPNIERTTGVEALRRQIGPAEHYLFVLVDGLGADQLPKLPADGFLRAHLADELQSVFLSTTAAALTTLATAQWPAAHAVPGWWTYLDEPGLSAITLPFQERATGQPLGAFGVSVEQLLPLPGIWSTITHKPLSVIPAKLTETTYSAYLAGHTLRLGYTDIAQALAFAAHAALNAPGASYTYVYLPELDSLMHHHGTDDPQVGALLLQIEQELARLHERLAGKARLIISADHGQADVPPDRNFVLAQDDPLAALLLCPPTGEPTTPIFHVHRGQADAFAAQFLERFGEHFVLLTADEVERLRLLGPMPLSPLMKRRLGTFLGIALLPAKFSIEHTGGATANIGVHGGLTKQEMTVPLFLA